VAMRPRGEGGRRSEPFKPASRAGRLNDAVQRGAGCIGRSRILILRSSGLLLVTRFIRDAPTALV
jgi:hypothetical protein